MIRHHDLRTVIVEDLSAHLAEGLCWQLQQITTGNSANTENKLWTDKQDLFPEIRFTCLDFFWLGIAIVRRTRFQNIRDEYLVAGETDGFEHFC